MPTYGQYDKAHTPKEVWKERQREKAEKRRATIKAKQQKAREERWAK